ncbi:MAG: hypothetical protein WKG06_45520 [Segetibacter sp.]
MEAIAAGYIIGNIQLNNHSHLEKLIQLFYIIQNAAAPKEPFLNNLPRWI